MTIIYDHHDRDVGPARDRDRDGIGTWDRDRDRDMGPGWDQDM